MAKNFLLSIPLKSLFYVALFWGLRLQAQTTVELRFYESFSGDKTYSSFDRNNVKLKSSGSAVLENCLGRNAYGAYVFKVKTPPLGSVYSYEVVLQSLPPDSYIDFLSSKYININSSGRDVTSRMDIADYVLGYRLKDEKIESLDRKLSVVNGEVGRLKKDLKKLQDILKLREETIAKQKIAIADLEATIVAKKEEIDNLNAKIVGLENDKIKLNQEIAELKKYIECQTGKNNELIDILVTQRKKLYFSHMKMINCQCEDFERKKRKGQVTLSFNLISTSNALLEDSVFIQGEEENLSVDFFITHRNPNKSDSLMNMPYKAFLDGSPQIIVLNSKSATLDEKGFNSIVESKKREKGDVDKEKFSKTEIKKAAKKAKKTRKTRMKNFKGNKSIKSSTGLYEIVVRNSEGFEVGRRSFSALASTCRPRIRKQKELDGFEVVILPTNNRSFNAISTTFNVYETETKQSSGLNSDGDRIAIYDCDFELKNCIQIRESHLIQNNLKENLNDNIINHVFNYERGYILTKHVVTGSTNGCSVMFDIANVKGESLMKLTPSKEKEPMISGFKYEIDPIIWWLCKPPQKK